jgi:oligopeptide/dipeptide ABC transporter ATP-binding protein
MPLLSLQELKVNYRLRRGVVQAVDNVSFDVMKGENLGLLGESGCGKSTIAKAILRLLPPNGKIVGGRILFENRDIVQMKEKEVRDIRWNKISMIPQSAMNALDPVYRIYDQIAESIQIHRKLSRRDLRSRASELFRLVGLDTKRLIQYPHQYSGGMKQRAIIAMALSLDPSLVILDEPTTALDVILQNQILNEIRFLRSKIGGSMLIITHDVSVIAATCNKAAVMYAGQMVEQGTTEDIFKNPHHPYTLALKSAFPDLTNVSERLIAIPGAPPELIEPPAGCRFADRCVFAKTVCRETKQQLVKIEGSHQVACSELDRVHRMVEEKGIEEILKAYSK